MTVIVVVVVGHVSERKGGSKDTGMHFCHKNTHMDGPGMKMSAKRVSFLFGLVFVLVVAVSITVFLFRFEAAEEPPRVTSSMISNLSSKHSISLLKSAHSVRPSPFSLISSIPKLPVLYTFLGVLGACIICVVAGLLIKYSPFQTLPDASTAMDAEKTVVARPDETRGWLAPVVAISAVFLVVLAVVCLVFDPLKRCSRGTNNDIPSNNLKQEALVTDNDPVLPEARKSHAVAEEEPVVAATDGDLKDPHALQKEIKLYYSTHVNEIGAAFQMIPVCFDAYDTVPGVSATIEKLIALIYGNPAYALYYQHYIILKAIANMKFRDEEQFKTIVNVPSAWTDAFFREDLKNVGLTDDHAYFSNDHRIVIEARLKDDSNYGTKLSKLTAELVEGVYKDDKMYRPRCLLQYWKANFINGYISASVFYTSIQQIPLPDFERLLDAINKEVVNKNHRR